MVLLVIMLVATITTLYDLTIYIFIHNICMKHYSLKHVGELLGGGVKV